MAIPAITPILYLMKQAFSLIELLVVVTIIGILASVSIVTLNQLSSRSRDSSRRESLSAYATSLEQYKAASGHYVVDQTILVSGSPMAGGYSNNTFFNGEGWGRLTRKLLVGLSLHYANNISIAYVLQQKGYLAAVQTDPSLKNFPSGDVDSATTPVPPIRNGIFTNDFFLLVCKYDGSQAVVNPPTSNNFDVIIADGIEFALYANLENGPVSGPNVLGRGECGNNYGMSKQIQDGTKTDPDVKFSNFKRSYFNYSVGSSLIGH